jgi:hypothetical protein
MIHKSSKRLIGGYGVIKANDGTEEWVEAGIEQGVERSRVIGTRSLKLNFALPMRAEQEIDVHEMKTSQE